MANLDRPDGFRPVRYLSGAVWNGQVSKYVVTAAHATAVFLGDIVELTGGVGTDVGKEYRAIQTLTVTDNGTPAGVVVAFEENPDNLNITGLFRPTGAQTRDRIAYVVDDPNVLFEAQVPDTGLPATAIGLNVGSTLTAGSTATGRSAHELATTEVTTAAIMFKLIDIVRREDNKIEDIATTGARWLVKFNAFHQFLTITGSTGV